MIVWLKKSYINNILRFVIFLFTLFVFIIIIKDKELYIGKFSKIIIALKKRDDNVTEKVLYKQFFIFYHLFIKLYICKMNQFIFGYNDLSVKSINKIRVSTNIQ
jgi:hypothetical protein